MALNKREIFFCILEYAHFHNDVRDYLNTNSPQRWLGQFRQDDVALMCWPPRSPDLTPYDFFLVRICKGHCLCTSIPR